MLEKIISMFFVKKTVRVKNRCKTLISKTREIKNDCYDDILKDKLSRGKNHTSFTEFNKQRKNEKITRNINYVQDINNEETNVKTCLSSYFKNVINLKKPAALSGRAENDLLFRTVLYNRQERGKSDDSYLSRDVYRNFSRD